MAPVHGHRKLSVRLPFRDVAVDRYLGAESGKTSTQVENHSRRRVGAKGMRIETAIYSYAFPFIS